MRDPDKNPDLILGISTLVGYPSESIVDVIFPYEPVKLKKR